MKNLGKLFETYDADQILKQLNEQEEGSSKEQMAIFSKVLGYARSLAIFYQTSHWQMKGMSYYGDHLLFERLYNGVAGEIDGIAEKAIGITTQNAVVSIPLHVKYIQNVLNGMPATFGENKEYFQKALELEKTYTQILQNAVKNDIFPEGTKDFFAGMQDTHEGYIYLIQQRLK